MWFRLLTSIVVLENKIVALADGAWQCILDCIDRFVALFTLGGQSASLLKSAAEEISSAVILSASFAEHVYLLKVHCLGYAYLVVIVERFVSSSMNQITVCLS